ncbi:PadR family transcriptional regulator [Streptomyces sp. NPDC058239]|uniref:PadR family transcriptional regulator n=1 Tax=Streptomyces sp. NPDC058239 TaxID=3346395 RepID=UPI0036E8CF69
MKLDHVLLALLSFRPYSGYDLRKWLEIEGQFIRSRAHHSQIYRVLARMMADGWVEYEVDPREGRPDAKVYRLTPLGREELLAWVRSPYEPVSRFQDVDFQARFGFTAALDREAAIRMVDTELDYRRAQITRNRDRDRTLRFENPLPELDTRLVQQVFDRMHTRGAAWADQWVEWLEEMKCWLEEAS